MDSITMDSTKIRALVFAMPLVMVALIGLLTYTNRDAPSAKESKKKYEFIESELSIFLNDRSGKTLDGYGFTKFGIATMFREVQFPGKREEAMAKFKAIIIQRGWKYTGKFQTFCKDGVQLMLKPSSLEKNKSSHAIVFDFQYDKTTINQCRHIEK